MSSFGLGVGIEIKATDITQPLPNGSPVEARLVYRERASTDDDRDHLEENLQGIECIISSDV
jgi:hypothetical protein